MRIDTPTTWYCALGLLVALALANPEVAAAAGEQDIDFNRDIRPILSGTCFKCHGPDAETRQKGFRLDTREGALAELQIGGRGIVPGHSARSQVIARISSSDPEKRMPPREAGKQLSKEQIDLLRRWVDEGAEYARHWSFVRVERPALPSVSKPQWVRNPIDAYVLARLDSEGLQPSSPVDRYTLIRRVSLDLTGLPPTIQEVNRFVSDQRPDAYEHLVDRLLASPAYGERWAQVWLDLARYADSAGYAQDPARTIWRYRDWLIAAINRNLSFDKFTIEQIAGDMLPKPTEDQLLATAFHRNTMTNSEGGTDDEEFRVAAVVDRVNTTMEVWMGMTMSCAQCHSHKYDPITQEEYYRVFAILNNTADADRGNEQPTLATLPIALQGRKRELEAQIAQAEKEVAAAPRDEKQPAAPKGPLQTRFVRVELPGKQRILSLAEVQVFAGDVNLAAKGKASQSSTAFNGPAGLAIDNKTDGNYNDAKTTTHTNTEDNPWWEVDLGSATKIERVVIWNRTDNGLQTRLAGVRVVLLDAKRRPLFVHTLAKAPLTSAAVAVPARGDKLNAAQLAALAKINGGDSPADRKLASLRQQLAALKPVTTPIMRQLPAGQQRKTHVHIRGNFRAQGKEVQPGVPAAFHQLPTGVAPDRLHLAKWLVDRDNPLTARVTVNRFWEQLFGMGLVQTSEDFGLQGELPSHPQLLDYLAWQLMENGWDTKQLLKLIVTSSTYKQTSKVSASLQDRDQFNRLLARGPRRRLSAEMIRDQALFTAGLLSSKMYGPSVRPPQPTTGIKAAFGGSTDWKTSTGEDRYRRGLYTSWRRTTPYPSMVTFDAPSREVCTIRRIRTNTPLQALVTLNDVVYVEAAQALARRMVSEGGVSNSDRARHGFRLVLSRPPSDAELAQLVRLFEQTQARYRKTPDQATPMATDPIGPVPAGGDVVELAAWTVVGNVLLNLDETLARP